MAIAIDPTVPFEYVLLADREEPVEKQTRWRLRGLTKRERAMVDDSLATRMEDGSLQLKQGAARLSIVRCGLLGFDNFRFADGNAARFEMDGEHVADATLDLIDDDDLTEIANAITTHGKLSEKDSD